MSYLAELHEAHKARIARMGGKTPKLERKVVLSDTRSANPRSEAPPASEPVAPVRAIIPRPVRRFLVIRDIIRITCAAFNVQPYQITVKDRRVPLCQARQIVVYMLRKHSNLTWGKISQMLGGYDTSSLRHSRCKIRRMLETDAYLMSIVEGIEREIARLPNE